MANYVMEFFFSCNNLILNDVIEFQCLNVFIHSIYSNGWLCSFCSAHSVMEAIFLLQLMEM